jgi:hypothetical protein
MKKKELEETIKFIGDSIRRMESPLLLLIFLSSVIMAGLMESFKWGVYHFGLSILLAVVILSFK